MLQTSLDTYSHGLSRHVFVSLVEWKLHHEGDINFSTHKGQDHIPPNFTIMYYAYNIYSELHN